MKFVLSNLYVHVYVYIYVCINIVLAMEPQPSTSKQSTLKKEYAYSGIPTRVHHRLPGLTLLPV